jgi:hypothetical protein
MVDSAKEATEKDIHLRRITDMFHHGMRMFHASKVYIVMVHFTTHMKHRHINENHLFSKPIFL